jgi:lambda family phage portal protein
MMNRPQFAQPPVQRTVLDRLIGWASPRAGLIRLYHRQQLQRAYEAANPRDGWKPRRGGASANADHYGDAVAIRNKARSLYQNVPYVYAGVEGRVSAAIGTGITTYATGAQAELKNQVFAEWSKVCDADGRLSLGAFLAAAYRARRIDGEVLIRLRWRRASDGLPVPLQLQLLEIDWLDSTRMSAPGAGGAMPGNTIINGIEYDVLGKAAAYWLWDQHPGEIGLVRARGRTQSKRVPASEFIHFFRPERPGQGRGISSLASIITRVRDVSLLEDAEIARKNLESRLSVLVSGDPSALSQADVEGMNQARSAATGDLGPLASGGITQLPPGMNVTTVAPNASPGFIEHIKHEMHIVSTAMGATYEMCTGDMTEVNFSSARVRQGDLRRDIEAEQWHSIIPNLCVPIWQAFISAGVLGGQWRTNDATCDHSTPKWDYTNPDQDASSELKLISSGLLTISESLRRRGYNPDAVFKELESDFKKLGESGVLQILFMLQKGRFSVDGNGSNTPANDGSSSNA